MKDRPPRLRQTPSFGKVISGGSEGHPLQCADLLLRQPFPAPTSNSVGRPDDIVGPLERNLPLPSDSAPGLTTSLDPIVHEWSGTHHQPSTAGGTTLADPGGCLYGRPSAKILRSWWVNSASLQRAPGH